MSSFIKKLIVVGAFSTILGLFFLNIEIVSAAQPISELRGFAWSSNIGWISMNCKDGLGVNQNTCATVDYGVKVDTVTGALTGYAWSPNIGWLKFGGLSNFPIGAGTNAVNARLTSDNKIEGWARFCAGMDTVPNSNQSTPNNTCLGSSRTDGWDGWLSLTGANYGVRLQLNNYVEGFAWGSTVVGWVSFAQVVGSPVLSVSLTANPTTIPSGSSTVLTWTTTNATSCTMSAVPINSQWSGAMVTPLTAGSKSVTGLIQNTTFTLTCLDTNSTQASSSVTVMITGSPISAPVPFAATLACDAVGGKIQFTWDTVASATGYRIYDYTGTTVLVTATTSQIYTQDDLIGGVQYGYYVSALSAQGTESSKASIVVTANTICQFGCTSRIDDNKITWQAIGGSGSYIWPDGSTKDTYEVLYTTVGQKEVELTDNSTNARITCRATLTNPPCTSCGGRPQCRIETLPSVAVRCNDIRPNSNTSYIPDQGCISGAACTFQCPDGWRLEGGSCVNSQCTFNGQNYEPGEMIRVYEQSIVSAGNSCVPISIVCGSNGWNSDPTNYAASCRVSPDIDPF